MDNSIAAIAHFRVSKSGSVAANPLVCAQQTEITCVSASAGRKPALKPTQYPRSTRYQTSDPGVCKARGTPGGTKAPVSSPDLHTPLDKKFDPPRSESRNSGETNLLPAPDNVPESIQLPDGSATSDVIPRPVLREIIERSAEGLAKMVDHSCCSSDCAPLTSAVSTAVRFSQEDQTFLRSREETVSHGVAAVKEMAKALVEIRDYKDGLFWEDYGTFALYCRARWDIQKAHAYRLCNFGVFLTNLEKQSPIGDWQLVHESQVRPILRLPTEHQVPCWIMVFAESSSVRLTAKLIAGKVSGYLAAHPEIPRRDRKSDGSKAEATVNAKTAQPEISTVEQSRELAPQTNLEDLFQEFYSRSKDHPRAAEIHRLLRRVHGLMYAPPPPFEETKDG